jgi:hypothetical protein
VDLQDLTTVLSAQGPFVTVHVDAESDVEQAADKYDLEWRAVLSRLEEQGVAEPVRQALTGARGEHLDGGSRLVVAGADDAQVRLAVSLPSRAARSTVSVGALPDLLPLVDDLQTRVPHVVVLADRRGAEISARYDMDRVATDVTVKGTTLHLRKVQSGGWAHRRYLHRVEEQWESNARDIATAVTQLAEAIGAEIVVGAGDLRALALVRDHLPTHLQQRWLEVEGTRGGDGSEQVVRQRISDAVALHVARATLDLLATFAQERGQHKRACDGLEDVVAALRKAQVQTLLVTTGTDPDRQLWFGEDPTQLGTTREEVSALGARQPQQGPAVAVLLRAALATGADAQVVPHEPEQAPRGGVGAVLRYADDSQP